MRILLSISLIATSALAALGHASVSKQPFTIAISAEKSVVKVGAPVLVTLQLTNTSDHEIRLGWWGQDNLGVIDVVDSFDVRDSHGHSLTKKERNPNFPMMGNFGGVMAVEPGKVRSYVQDYSRWFDLGHPGEYTIQALRPVSENKKDGVVKSNKITITITK